MSGSGSVIYIKKPLAPWFQGSTGQTNFVPQFPHLKNEDSNDIYTLHAYVIK